MEELQAVSHDVYRLRRLPLETLLPSFAPQTLDSARHTGVSSPHRINQHSPELFCLSHPHKLITAPLGLASLLSVNLKIYFHLFPLFQPWSVFLVSHVRRLVSHLSYYTEGGKSQFSPM